MLIKEGKYTIETYAKEQNLSRQSAINALSKLKKRGFVKTSGGRSQKRIYTISKVPKKEPNGFFFLLNKYSPEKIAPSFEHYVYGKYTAENAIVDGIILISQKKDSRIREGLLHLFRHIKNWKILFDLAKKQGITDKIHELYYEARLKTKCKTIQKSKKNCLNLYLNTYQKI